MPDGHAGGDSVRVDYDVRRDALAAEGHVLHGVGHAASTLRAASDTLSEQSARERARQGADGGEDISGVVWSSEDAQRASTPTTVRESRCTLDEQRRRPRAPTLNY
eukprot:436128-Pyramimonas_sp.AAC.1